MALPDQSAPAATNALQVGAFKVEPDLDRITGPRGTNRLNPKATAVLLSLARRPGELVSKHELLGEVWGESFVSDEVLTNAVWELRKAFGDDARDPRMIATVHGKGYRLIAPVADAGPPAAAEPAASRRRTGLWLSLAVLAILGAALRFLGPSAAERALERGRAALHQRTFEEAVRELQAAIARDPGLVDAYDLLANVYDIQGSKELALEHIERALENAGDLDPVARLKLERRRAQILDDVAGELDVLEKLYLKDPDPLWHFKLGWFYKTHRRDCNKSLKRYEDAVAGSGEPVEAIAYAYWGETLLSCGQPAPAIAKYRRFAELSGDASGWEILANGYVLTGDYEGAGEALARAAALDPDFEHLSLQRGHLLAARGLYAQAEEQYELARSEFEAPSQEARALVYKARVQLVQGRFPEAIASVDAALAEQRGSVQAWWIRGWALVEMGELERAREIAARMAVLRPGSEFEKEYLLHLRAEIALAGGDLDTAVSTLERALEQHPDEGAFFRAAFAEALAETGDLALAEAAYLATFEINPNHGPARCGLAELYDGRGAVDAARREYRSCLRIFGEENEQEPRAVHARRRLRELGVQGARPTAF